MVNTQVVLDERWVMEGAQAFKQGAQRWQAWNAVIQNHTRFGRLSEEEQAGYVSAALAMVRELDRRWLDSPDIW
jgi:hypothetical protein